MINLRIFIFYDNEYKDIFTGNIEQLFSNKIILNRKQELIIEYKNIQTFIDEDNICRVHTDNNIYFFSFKTNEDRDEFHEAINIRIEENNSIIKIYKNDKSNNKLDDKNDKNKVNNKLDDNININNNNDNSIENISYEIYNFKKRNNNIKYLNDIKKIRIGSFLIENNLIEKFIKNKYSLYNMLLLQNKYICKILIDIKYNNYKDIHQTEDKYKENSNNINNDDNNNNITIYNITNSKHDIAINLYDSLKDKYPVRCLKEIIMQMKIDEDIENIKNNYGSVEIYDRLKREYNMFSYHHKIVIIENTFIKDYYKILYFIYEKDENMIYERMDEILMKKILLRGRNCSKLNLCYLIDFIKNIILIDKFKIMFFNNFKYLFVTEDLKEYDELISLPLNDVIMEFLCYLAKNYSFYLKFYFYNGFFKNLKVDDYFIRIMGDLIDNNLSLKIIEDKIEDIKKISKKYLMVKPIADNILSQIK